MSDPEVEGLKAEIARLRKENSALQSNNIFLIEQIKAMQDWIAKCPIPKTSHS